MSELNPREYQEKIAKACIEKNCLVVLPTGLGKTLIATLVAEERLEQFKESKILILAPTRPLVNQHIESFRKSKKLEIKNSIALTGKIPAQKRIEAWENAQIIFATPQTIAHDLKHNRYTLKDVSLLVEDEAHRCLKNYDYTFVAKKYLEQGKNQRIVGLTASPGSDLIKIEEICENLSVEAVEFRTRESTDVKPYLQELLVEKITVDFPPEFEEIRLMLKQLFNEYIEELRIRGYLREPATKLALINLQKKLGEQITRNREAINEMLAVSTCAQALKISHALELVETQTLEGFKSYLDDLIKQAESKKSRGVIRLVQKKEFLESYKKTKELLERKMEHPKIQETKKIIEEELSKNKSSRIIVFTQFRDSGKILSKKLNENESIRSKVFVGQMKKRETGLNQKEQIAMIHEFREGKINVICATSIAEEGLDIPEVNVVIFYEPVSSAIRKIQRTGRTARVAKGKLFVLVTKNTRDESSYYSGKRKEKKMEEVINSMKHKIFEKKDIQTRL